MSWQIHIFTHIIQFDEPEGTVVFWNPGVHLSLVLLHMKISLQFHRQPCPKASLHQTNDITNILMINNLTWNFISTICYLFGRSKVAEISQSYFTQFATLIWSTEIWMQLFGCNTNVVVRLFVSDELFLFWINN
jgi:hypothetical protein